MVPFYLHVLLFSFSAFSGRIASIFLHGFIHQQISLDLTTEPITTDLPLSMSQTDTLVATIQERSNSDTGFSVTITSANVGSLRHGGSFFPYQLKYDGKALNLKAPVVITTADNDDEKTSRPVTISYTGMEPSSLDVRNFNDTVTFSITAN